MGRQDVQQALRAMEADDTVRVRLAAGDFAAVEGLDLSAEEQTLVEDAASDMPEGGGVHVRHVPQARRHQGRVHG